MVKKIVIEKCMCIIKKYNNYDDVKLTVIEYGLTALYLTISKLLIISAIAIILHIFKEMILFILIYNIIRMPSFGIHATKSWLCLLVSTIGFIGVPIICMNISIPLIFKLMICFFGVILIFKNSPADTKKKPIVNPKRRLTYKIISTFIALIYMILSVLIKNNLLANYFVVSIIMQNIVISPITYRVFKQPYNNYKNYLKLHPDFLN